MEKLPYPPSAMPVVSTLRTAIDPACNPDDWRLALPTLTGSMVTLREIGAADAPALYAALTRADASRFASPPTVDEFERFIEAAQRRRATGEYACFAVVPRNSEPAVGWFQVRSLEPGFKTAEWDFALAVEYWGTGVFVDGARLALDFVFAAIGAHRLEPRVAVENGRGNGALRKIGAVRECELRGSFLHDGEYHDQRLWTILLEEWHEARPISPMVVH